MRKDRRLPGKARVRARKASQRAARARSGADQRAATVPTSSAPDHGHDKPAIRASREYLGTLTVKELKALAKSEGVRGYSTKTKDGLVETLFQELSD